MSWVVSSRDCIEAMAEMEEASIDSIVCDPPYLIGFMGKEFDSQHKTFVERKSRTRAGSFEAEHGNHNPTDSADAARTRRSENKKAQIWHEAWAREALRVLKPGGHLLAFGGTRTYHRLAAGIEDAGFEIRDTIAWMYGSGFPKSLDVGKAIDKAAGAERERVGDSPYTARRTAGDFGIVNDDGWEPTDHGVTAPATPEAEQWDGWGTALKPAWESILVAVKPDPESERQAIEWSLCLLGNRIASLSPVNPAVRPSESSPAEHDAALLASAQWTADERSNTRDALCALTDTSLFESAITTSLNIVSSWLDTLAAISDPTNTSTTAMGSSTTTAWRTLKSSLLDLTPLTIIQAVMSPDGSTWRALPAARAFDAVESSIRATRELSAIASAIEREHISRRVEGGPEPQLEPIVVARKPLGQTVAANVLEYGVGALNIDGCRIEMEDEDRADTMARNRHAQWGSGPRENDVYGTDARDRSEGGDWNPTGRWPANVALDEQAAAMLDEQTGGLQPSKGAYERKGGEEQFLGQMGDGRVDEANGIIDSGGASRFFYCAKSSTVERSAGLPSRRLLRLREDLTDEQRALVMGRLREAGVGV